MGRRGNGNGIVNPTITRKEIGDAIRVHVDHALGGLPGKFNAIDANSWFSVCQWNARADFYALLVERFRVCCSKHNKRPCTNAQARAHLADLLERSERTIARCMIHRTMPTLKRTRVPQ